MQKCTGYMGWSMRSFLFSLLVVAVLPTAAFAYCSEPSAPSCASGYGAFEDEWEYDRCKNEMESYKSEVEDFISCERREAQDVVDEAERKAESAASDYSDAVDDFNRRTR